MTRAPKNRIGSAGNTRDRHMAALTDFDRSLLTLSHQSTKVRIAGETQTMTIQEAVAWRTAQSALEGNSHAQWLFQHQTAEAARRLEEEKAAERAALEEFFLAQTRRLRAATSAGHPTDLILPHPDDIDFSLTTGPAIRGPASEEEWLDCVASARMRDAWLVQDAFDRALQGRRRSPNHVSFDSGCIAILIDLNLPKRLRLTLGQWVNRRWHLARLPMRQLLKDCRKAWLACGIDVARGTHALAPRYMEDLVGLLFSAMQRVRAAKDDSGAVREAVEDIERGVRQIARAMQAEGGD